MPKNFTSLPPVASPRRGAPSPWCAFASRAHNSARRARALAAAVEAGPISSLSALKDEDPSLRGLVEAEAVRELASNHAGDGAAGLSRAVHTEVALLHCLEAVQHLPVPNRFRTECVCQLFDRLAAGLGRHEPLLRELQGELFASIYEGFKPAAGGCVKAWFEVAQALQAQVDAAQRERREGTPSAPSSGRRLNALLASEDSGSTLVKALVFEGLKRQALRRQHDETARQNERLVDACIAHADELAHAKQACLSVTVRTVSSSAASSTAPAPRGAARGADGGRGASAGGRRRWRRRGARAAAAARGGSRSSRSWSNCARRWPGSASASARRICCAAASRSYAAENAALAVRAEAAEKLAAEKAEAAENLQARLEELRKAASDAANGAAAAAGARGVGVVSPGGHERLSICIPRAALAR